MTLILGVTGRGPWLTVLYFARTVQSTCWMGSYSTKLSSEEGSLKDQYISSVTRICLKVLRASAEMSYGVFLNFFTLLLVDVCSMVSPNPRFVATLKSMALETKYLPSMGAQMCFCATLDGLM